MINPGLLETIKVSLDDMDDAEYAAFIASNKHYAKYIKDMNYERKINGGK